MMESQEHIAEELSTLVHKYYGYDNLKDYLWNILEWLKDKGYRLEKI